MSAHPARRIGFGVVGCGTIAYWTHLRILRSVPGATLVAAADPDPRARARAAELGGVAVHDSAAALLARGDIDAVVIATPTGLLADLTVAACAAGKHVYVEKPCAATPADALRSIEAATRAGVTAMAGFNRRFHPLHRQARELIAEGRLGRVHAVRCTFCEPVAADRMPAWKRQRASGGGVLLDLASHHIDLLRWFLGDEPGAVDARMHSDATEQDTAQLRLSMRGGTVVDGLFGFRAGPADCLEFLGERGTLRVDRHRSTLDWRIPRRLGYGVRSGWLMPSPAALAYRVRRLARPSLDPSYIHALAAFAQRIRDGATPVPGLDDALRTLEVVRAAEESARSGVPVPCSGDRLQCASC